ncbi:MAG: biopolymer transporter ExbD [Nitrospirae bacterium]|nr:biopolymer transporter ExbD [Nitrospirota bacterium]
MLPKPSSRKHRLASESELQIITFLNLMVILIPFLLMTTVFAKMAVIELTTPASSQKSTPPPAVKKDQNAGFRLTIALLDDEINVLNGETTLGIFKKDTGGKYDLTGLPPLISKLKQQYPGENDAVILSSPKIPYMTIVEVIDAVRGHFPGISLNEL